MAEKVIINFEANTSKAVKSVDALDSSVKKTGTTTTATTGAMTALNTATGGLMAKFAALKTGLMAVVAGFVTMKVAIIATGIGALVLGIIAVQKAFTNTEEGQNKFAKIMAVIASITGNLGDMLAKLGEAIIDVFTNPIQALKDFAKAIKQNIINRFVAALDTVKFLGSAIKKVFKGDLVGAINDAKRAGSSLIDTFTGVQDALDKAYKAGTISADEFINETRKAAAIADKQAKLRETDRKLLIERAKADRDRADLLEKAVNKEKFALQERIGFLQEAGDLESKITDQEIQSAKIKLQNQIDLNKMAGSKTEDLDAVAQLEADLIRLETARLTKQKEVTSQIIALRNEEKATIAANSKELKDSIKADADELKAFTDVTRDKREKERAELDEQANLLREKFKNDKDALLEIENSYLVQSTTLQDKFDKEDEEKQKVKDEKEKERLAKIAEDEIIRVKTLADEKERIAQKELEFQQAKDTAIAISKANMQNILTGLEDTGIKKSKAGQAIYKAIALTQIGLDSAIAISKASALANAEGIAAQAAFPFVPGIGTIARVLSYASTVAQVGSNIARAKQLLSSGGAGGVGNVQSSRPSQIGGAAQAPQFNIVGQGDGNQIASALAEQQQTPIQAFVVSQDVTTAQSIERGIINGSTLGS